MEQVVDRPTRAILVRFPVDELEKLDRISKSMCQSRNAVVRLAVYQIEDPPKRILSQEVQTP